jgi:phospholipid/cholesterol/gamma-HCH transport system substrate-binding protein
MNNTSQTVRVGLFFVLGLALAWITFESLNGGHMFKPRGFTLVAGFANLKGLKAGDEVRMAGVKVGSVQLTRLAPNRVEALLNIEPGTQIPVDAVASVEQSSLLGSNYLGVSFGTPGGALLKDGEEIRTKPTVDMSEVISQLGTLGSKLEQVIGDIGKSMGIGGESGNLFQRLDKLVTENGPRITETVSNLQDITARIKGGEGTIGKLVNDPKMHDELLASVGEIKLAAAEARTFLGDTQRIVADVKGGRGTLGVLLYDEATASSIKVTAANLRELSDRINAGQGTLGRLLADDSMHVQLQGVMKKADRALDNLGDSGPITALGVLAGALF